jgi:hypothetical protein
MIRSTTPDAYIVFFPYVQPRTEMGKPFETNLLDTEPLLVRSELIAVSTQKSKGGAGSWNCTIAPSKNFKALIQPGSWCMIYMSNELLTSDESDTSGNALDSGLKMMGIVKSVRAVEAVDPNSGTRTFRFELSGDDFHSVFESQVYVNPELRPPGGANSSPIIDSEVYFKKPFETALSPADMSTFLIETLLGKREGLGNGILDAGGGKAGGVYAVPPKVAARLTGAAADGDLFVNLLNFKMQKDLYGSVTFQPQLSSLFTLWSMLESFSHKVLNEIYTDLQPKEINGKLVLVPTIIHRCIPFTSRDFKPTHQGKDYSIPTLTIEPKKEDAETFLFTSRQVGEDEIFAINYGKSDAERFNFFFVSNNYAAERGLSAVSMASLLSDDTSPISQNPLGDPNSVARNGLRPFITSSNYLQNDNDAFIACNLVVRDMWHEAYKYENGQMSLIGTREHIPVGTNIEFVERDWICHVEAVGNSFSVSPAGYKTFRTNISFVRLQKLNGTPIDFAEDRFDEKSYHQNITAVNKEDT